MGINAEHEGQHRIDECEATAYQTADKLAAMKALTSCSNQFAEEKVSEWWTYAFSLFAKFGRYVVTSNETEQGEVLQRYPAWWLRDPEVGFVNWSPSGRPSASSDVDPLQRVSQDWPFSMRMFAGMMPVGVVAIAALAHQWGFRRGAQCAKREDDYTLLA